MPRSSLLAASLLGLLGPLAVHAQSESTTEPVAEDKTPATVKSEAETVITATRMPEEIANIPGSVTVVTRKDLDAQSQVSNRNLGDILGRLVPGLALGNQSTSTFGQTLRGRNVLVMIDGVPQSAIRNVQHDLQAIDPETVERIEVIRGTTAIYGEGASGGIINIITRRPGHGEPKLTTTFETSTAPTDVVSGFAGTLAQSVAGSAGPIGYALTGSIQRTGGFFDAEGDLIPPDPHGQGGLADTTNYNVMGKLRWRIDNQQRFQLGLNHFQGTQVTTWSFDPSVKELPAYEQKARAIQGLELQDPQETRNSVANLQWEHDDILGSTVRAQAFYRNHLTRFFPFDARSFPKNYGDNIVQSRLESQKGGGRLEIGTPLPFNLSALWGLDASMERSSQPVALMDHGAFDNSGGLVFRTVGERGWVPQMDLSTLGAFAQLEWAAHQMITLRAGVRQEFTGLTVPDYVTLVDNPVQGGQLDFARTLFNAGVVVAPTETLNMFVNFAQGYSLPDVGLILRNATPATPGGTVSVAELNTAPQAVDLIEVGARATWEKVQSSLSVFYNRSDLGTSSGGLNAPVVRAPERVYGLEATLDVRPIETLRIGSAFTWLEGQLDKANDGNYTFLNSYRIPPPKLLAYAEHETLPNWRNGVTFVYSGPRRRFGDSTKFGERPITPYFTIDLTSSYPVGPGLLRVGVANLLNAQYYTRDSQLLRSGANDTYAAARGRLVTLGYSVSY